MTDSHPTDELLERFRRWLEEARAEAEARAHEEPVADAEVPEVGLYRLAEEFTALRHELKLQTRSARGVQEQTEALLPALREAIEQFRASAATVSAPTSSVGASGRPAESVWSAVKPLAEALADLDEALARGRAEIEKARPQLVEEPDTALAAALDAHLARQSWLRRWRYRGYHAEVRALIGQHTAEVRQPFFEAFREGYDLILARLRRALESTEIERIACVGRPVDPERMIVLEVVEDPNRPAGEVVDEVRRGYTWRGRVFRFAEVRAARAPLPRCWNGPAQAETAAELADSRPEVVREGSDGNDYRN
jgi:molecular chaperone GrpE